MYRFLLAPRWLALHAFVVAVVVSFTWLGAWQFSSYEEQRREGDRRAQAPVPVADLVRPGAAVRSEDVDRNVTARGAYERRSLLVPGRILDGVVGTFVVTPLRLDTGGSVLVLRGWVASADAAAAATPPDGQVTVTGVLRPDETEEAAVPLGRPLRVAEIPYVSNEAAVEAGGPADLLAGWVLLAEETPGTASAPEPVPLEQVARRSGAGIWQNLSYAAQWWVFAVAALVFWGAFVRAAVRERREPDGEAAADDEEPVRS
ncbi:MAG TPA: SURF1 family protein [Jiangellales bacterium]|nr:SURF1 family protein [Jiangellales bacterium]